MKNTYIKKALLTVAIILTAAMLSVTVFAFAQETHTVEAKLQFNFYNHENKDLGDITDFAGPYLISGTKKDNAIVFSLNGGGRYVFDLKAGSTFKVFKDFPSLENQQNITSDCSFDSEKQMAIIPEKYLKDDIIVIVKLPDDAPAIELTPAGTVPSTREGTAIFAKKYMDVDMNEDAENFNPEKTKEDKKAEGAGKTEELEGAGSAGKPEGAGNTGKAGKPGLISTMAFPDAGHDNRFKLSSSNFSNPGKVGYYFGAGFGSSQSGADFGYSEFGSHSGWVATLDAVIEYYNDNHNSSQFPNVEWLDIDNPIAVPFIPGVKIDSEYTYDSSKKHVYAARNGKGTNFRKRATFFPANCVEEDANGGSGYGFPAKSTWIRVDSIKNDIYYCTIFSSLEDRVHTNQDVQSIAGHAAFKLDEGGWLKLSKKSSNTSISNAHPSEYNLDGATYRVYKKSNNEHVGTFTIDEDGIGEVTFGKGKGTESMILEEGEYYIKEMDSPLGYMMDTTTHNVTISAGKVNKMSVSDAPKGHISVQKYSTNTILSNGLATYSLAGSVFGVYKNRDDAIGDINYPYANLSRLTTITTDSNGYGKSAMLLDRGNYVIRELKPPNGFERPIDPIFPNGFGFITLGDVYEVKYDVNEHPANAQVECLLRKNDRELLPNNDKAQMGAELKGAIFALEFYDGYYNTKAEAHSSGHLKRTWYLRTDGAGYVDFRTGEIVNNSEFSSSSLFMSNGNRTFPCGTYLFWEAKAPTGYLLPTKNKGSEVEPFILRVKFEPDDTSTTDGDPIAIEMQNDWIQNEDNPMNSDILRVEDVVRGDIELMKSLGNSDDLWGSNINLPEENATFDFYAPGQFDGLVIKNGVTQPAFSITTDAQGHADTRDIYVLDNTDGSYSIAKREEIDTPAQPGAKRGGIPFGTYLIVQRTSAIGYLKVPNQRVTISEDKKTMYLSMTNFPYTMTPRIIKLDSETGKQVFLPATWQIIDVSTGRPVSMIEHYPKDHSVDTFTSDNEGYLTLPEKLQVGMYELKEILAPSKSGLGYVRNPHNLSFEVGLQTQSHWDEPFEIKFSDVPAKGKIKIIKNDAGKKSDFVKDAIYEVRAKGDVYTLDETLRYSDGELVATLTTDEKGEALSDVLYLGNYTVKEVFSPEGWALDTNEHPISLQYSGQDVPVVLDKLELTENPTTVKLKKINSSNAQAIKGVELELARPDSRQVNVEVVMSKLKEAILAIPSLVEATDLSSDENPDDLNTVQDSYTASYSLDDETLIESLESNETQELKYTFDVMLKTDNSDSEEFCVEVNLTITINDDKSVSICIESEYESKEILVSYLGLEPLVLSATTDEYGFAIFNYIPHGTYNVLEPKVPLGFKEGFEPVEFIVEENGLIDGSWLLESSIENAPIIPLLENVTPFENIPIAKKPTLSKAKEGVSELPKTGDAISVLVFLVLFIVVAGFLIRKFKKTKSAKKALARIRME